MTTLPKDDNSQTTLPVRRGRVDSVDLYEVKENELEILEKGESDNLYLNFSIFLFSIAFSSILSLCSANSFKSQLWENLFLFISIIGLLGGGFLFLLWRRQRKSIKKTIQTIKNRIRTSDVPKGATVSVEQTVVEISTESGTK